MKVQTIQTIIFALAVSALVAEASPHNGQAALKKLEIPYHTVIAHRGASYYAPEETLAAYELARELGADYLEADLQRTKDGVIVALHDNNLKRTTNIKAVFPEKADKPVSDFTLEELKKLDAGSWFNKTYPDRARPTYVGLKILTLDELITVAEGGKNRPGIYLETKAPPLFPGIEKDISNLLRKRGWVESTSEIPKGFNKKKYVAVGYGKGRVILQTFDKTSLLLLHEYLPEVPLCFLLWLDDGAMASTTPLAKPAPGQSNAEFRATLQVSPEEFEKWVLFAKKNGATGTGPGATLTKLGDQSYMDLVKPWMNAFTHKQGLFIHAYTVDEMVDMKKLTDAGVDGFFTNRADVLIEFYGRKPFGTAAKLLQQLHY